MQTIRRAIGAADSLTVTHGAGAAADGEPAWLELLTHGMTFDLSGIAPGPGHAAPDVRNRYQVPSGFSDAVAEALALAPGPHLAGGRTRMAVVRMQAALAAHFVRELPTVAAIAWVPARTAIGRDFYLSAIDAWQADGPFPALGLTAFRRTLGTAVQSEGLAFFTGQELHFDPSLFPDPAAATRLGVRLVNELVGRAPLVEPVELAGPDGEPIVLEPSRNGRYLRVGHG
ncbi:hypothetical protein [Pelagerythrobacter sp.]|uniref:hypothetical protein n=1 Tax=Pelagerythrobacter sp. TaxID=2800702 RepID=UPI0035B23D6D